MIVMTNKTPPPRPKLLGEYLPCSPGSIQIAIQKKRDSKIKNQKVKLIGEILLSEKMISEDQLNNALRRQRAERLAHCPVFASLTSAELSGIGNHFSELIIDTDQQFIFEGEYDPTLYVLVNGKLEVFTHDKHNNEIHVAYVDPVQPIGEMGYFQDGIRSASIRSITPCILLKVAYKRLTHYFEHVPHVAFAFMDVIKRRQEETNRIIVTKKTNLMVIIVF